MSLPTFDSYIYRVEGANLSAIANMVFSVGPGNTRHQFGRNRETNEYMYESSYPGHQLMSIRSVGEGSKGSGAENAVSGCVFGWQLIDQEAKPITAAAFEQIEPTIAPQLLDWITR